MRTLSRTAVIAAAMAALLIPAQHVYAGGADTRIRVDLSAPNGPGSGRAEYRERMDKDREKFSAEVEDIDPGKYCVEVNGIILDADLDVIACPTGEVVGDLNMDNTFDMADLMAADEPDEICTLGGEREAFEDGKSELMSTGDCVRVLEKAEDGTCGDVVLQSDGCPTTSTTMPAATTTTMGGGGATTTTMDACLMCVMNNCALECDGS